MMAQAWMCADDDDAVRRILRKVLEAKSYRVLQRAAELLGVAARDA